MQRPAGGRGFTLIELIVALAVAGLLLATVPVALQRLYESSEYRATVRHVLAGLRAARSEAMRSGQPVAFVFDLNERHFGVSGRPPQTIPEALSLRFVVADREVMQEGVGRIRFYPDGSSTGGSVEVRREAGDGVRLRVDWLLGRIAQYPVEGGA